MAVCNNCNDLGEVANPEYPAGSSAVTITCPVCHGNSTSGRLYS